MKNILVFSIIICTLVIFWSCGSDNSNPVTVVNRNFDPFSLWDTASGALGTMVQCLAVKDTNLFAGTANSGIYRSTDNGDHWIQINTGLGNSNVTALFVKDSIVLAGTNGNGIFYSTNNGSQWLATAATAGEVSSFVRKGSNIFAGISLGVFASTDNGLTWNGAGSFGSPVTSVIVKGSRLFASTYSNGIYRSSNDGVNWSTINIGLSSLTAYALVVKDSMIFATSPAGVFRTSNDSTWKGFNDGLYPPYVTGLAHPVYIIYSSVLIGFSEYQGVYITLNNGYSWVSCNAGITRPFSAYAFTNNGTYLFAGGQNQGGTGGVWRHAL